MNAIWRPDHAGHRLHTHSAVTVLLACTACIALLALAACGVTSSAAPGGAQSTSRGQPFNAGAAVRPCSGPYASATEAAPALVLTLQTPGQSGSARIGQVMQVQLPITRHWTLISVPNGLQLVGEAAQQDAQRGVCFWNFKMATAGTYVIGFTGVTPCDPSAAICQQTTQTQRFTLTVS